MNLSPLDCAACNDRLCGRRAPLADYLEQRMLILRYGCMCPGQPRIRTAAQVAALLGLAKKFVDDRHLRWKRRGGLYLSAAQKKALHRPRPSKLLPVDRTLITSHDTLQAQAGLSLKERAVHIRQHMGLEVGQGTLRQLYKAAGVRFKRVDLHNVYKLRKAAEIRRGQRQHCDWLVRVMGNEKHVYWMDESSIHVWHQQHKTWSHDAEPVALCMQASRQSGRTMFLACGGEPFKCITQVSDTTDTDSVLLFLRHFVASVTEPIRSVVLVMDNHAAHHSDRVAAYCLRVRLSLKFLPPYSSPLNPVERIWGQVKHHWGKRMSQLRVPFDHDNIAHYVLELLDEVAAR